MAPLPDVSDLGLSSDDDDEGELPPLLPLGSTIATLPSKPSTAPKPAATKPESARQKVAKQPPAAAVTKPPSQKPGADLKPNNGFKKGFLSGGGGGSSSRSSKASSASSSGESGGGGGSRSTGGDVPMVRADVEARQKSLQLPEVQERIEAEKTEKAKLNQNKSWMTPELLQKIAAKPILRKAFTDPKCQQAMTEMQTNPQQAMQKYGDVPEMREFLQAFMKLMGEHFTELAEKQEKEQEAARKARGEPELTPEQKKAQEVAQKAMLDPEVRAIVAEPRIQKLLGEMQTGKAFELEAAARSDPEIVQKLKKLSVSLVALEPRSTYAAPLTPRDRISLFTGSRAHRYALREVGRQMVWGPADAE